MKTLRIILTLLFIQHKIFTMLLPDDFLARPNSLPLTRVNNGRAQFKLKTLEEAK
jgi:hypothetical protein